MWVARDKDGQLWLFTYKPRRSTDAWHYDDTENCIISNNIE